MINLIPPHAKRSITIEYWIRVITVWCMLLAFAATVGLLVMLPAYVLVSSQVDVYRQSAESASQEIQNYENMSSVLNRSTEQARIIAEAKNKPVLSEYVALFQSLESSDIRIREITLAREGELNIAPIRMIGEADTRQALADFRDRLLATEVVEVVDLPISNLAKDSNIVLNLTITPSNTPSI